MQQTWTKGDGPASKRVSDLNQRDDTIGPAKHPTGLRRKLRYVIASDGKFEVFFYRYIGGIREDIQT